MSTESIYLLFLLNASLKSNNNENKNKHNNGVKSCVVSRWEIMRRMFKEMRVITVEKLFRSGLPKGLGMGTPDYAVQYALSYFRYLFSAYTLLYRESYE